MLLFLLVSFVRHIIFCQTSRKKNHKDYEVIARGRKTDCVKEIFDW